MWLATWNFEPFVLRFVRGLCLAVAVFSPLVGVRAEEQPQGMGGLREVADPVLVARSRRGRNGRVRRTGKPGGVLVLGCLEGRACL